MTEAKTFPPPSPMSKRGRFFLQWIVGGSLGGGVTIGALTLLDGPMTIHENPQRLVALCVGLIFALMGLFVLFGTAVPKPGSVLLNVADEQELRDRSPDLRNSGLMCVLIGAILMTLSLTATETSSGLLSTRVGTIILVAGIAAITVAGFAMRGMGDELDRALSTEASALAMHASTILFGGWGILSYLGHVPFVGPLGLLSGMTAMYLAAIMWVAGRRGLLSS